MLTTKSRNMTKGISIGYHHLLAPPKEEKSFLSFFKTKEKIETLPMHFYIKNKKAVMDFKYIEDAQDKMSNKSDFVANAHNDYSNIKKYLESVSDKPLNIEIKIKSDNLMLDYVNFITLIDSAKTLVKLEDRHFLENNLGNYLLESLRSYTKNVDRFEIMQKAHDSGNFKKLFLGKSESDIDNLKERSDNECLRWIKLLEDQLELVKKNILEQINEDGLHDMKVRTKFLSARFPQASIESDRENPFSLKM